MKLDKNLTIQLRAKTFNFASFFLPRKIKKDIENLYIFCRYLDDIGDDKNIIKKKSIQKLNQIKKEILKKKTKNFIIMNFIQLQNKYNIENKCVLHLINGIKSDLKETVDIKDEKELIFYCYSVAGTVGYMFCKIINITDRDLFLRAIQLGIAMQRTNISRDIKEDLELNRIYLPKKMREFKGKKEKILKNKFLKQKISNSLYKFLIKTDSYYLNSWNGINKLPFRYSLSIGIAAELYQRIGIKIMKKNCNIWDERVHLKFLEKIFYTFSAIKKLFFVNKNIEEKIDSECNLLLKKIKIL
ncbi:MAG: hypothetical protein CL572_04640 [Alphaproteobacteria bacterium]|nr:hypothetical protein [Alphaproteobacteria bacterium]